MLEKWMVDVLGPDIALVVGIVVGLFTTVGLFLLFLHSPDIIKHFREMREKKRKLIDNTESGRRYRTGPMR
jgi:hypothetical protein